MTPQNLLPSLQLSDIFKSYLFMSSFSQNCLTQSTAQRLSLTYRTYTSCLLDVTCPHSYPHSYHLPSCSIFTGLALPAALYSFAFFPLVAYIFPNNDIAGCLTSFRSPLKVLITWFSLISIHRRTCPLHTPPHPTQELFLCFIVFS